MLYLLRRKLLILTQCLALFAGFLITTQNAMAQAGALHRGNLVVCSPTGGASSASVVKLYQFTPTGSIVDSVVIPSTGANELTTSGSATSEGFISLSAEKDRIILVGYAAAAGTASVASSTVNREIASIDSTETYVLQYSQPVLSALNARGGTSYGSNFFESGSNQGIYYMNTAALITTTASVNNRNMNIYAGNVYFTSGSGSYIGINQLGSGISTATGQGPTLVAACTSPYAFSISPNGLTAYVADATAGILKFTRTTNSGVFTAASYTVYGTACSGIAVDYTTSPATPIIYATLSTGLTLVSMVDNGSTVTSPTTLATTVATQPFRGIVFAPSVSGSISGTTSVCSGNSATITFTGNPHGLITYSVNGTPASIQLDSAYGQATLNTGSLTSTTTYTLGSETTPFGTTTISGSAVITISAGPTAITGSASTCVGSSTTLGDVTSGGTWTSSNTSIATIGSSSAVLTGVATGTVIITYALSSGCLTTATETINPAVSAITGTGSICAGSGATLGDLSGAGTWTSGNTAIVTIGPLSGTVTGVSGGSATISYTVTGGCFTTATEVVLPSSAGAITGSSYVCLGANVTLTNLAAPGGVWSSANSAIASVNSSTGKVTGVAYGSTNIIYSITNTCGTYSTSAPFTVTTVSVPVPSINPALVSLCPSSPAQLVYAYADTITGTVSTTSSTASFTLPVNAADTSTINVSSVPAGAVITGISVTINVNPKSSAYQSDNLFNLRAPNGAIINLDNFHGSSGAGFANVTYSSAGTLAQSTAREVSGNLYIASLINGAPTSGSFTTTSYRSNATTWASLYSMADGAWTLITDNNYNATEDTFENWTINISYAIYPSVTWSPVTGLYTNSGASTSYVSGAITNSVYALPVSTTTYTVTASMGGCTSAATVKATVNPTLYVPAISGLSSMCMGNNITLTDSTTGGFWTSSNTAVATIGSTSGLVTSVAAGTTIVTYTYNSGSCSGYSLLTLTVNALPVIPAISGTTNLCLSSSTVTLLSDGSFGGTWISSNPTVATVGLSSGIVNALATGNTMITYTYSNGTCTNTTTTAITVASSPSAMSITPASASVCPSGSAAMLVASGGNIPGTATASSGTISFSVPYSAAGVTTSLTVSGVPAGATVTNIAVTFNAIESYDGDMELNLMAPNASILNLMSTGTGNSGANFVNTTISSSGVTQMTTIATGAPWTGIWAANAVTSATVGSNVYPENTTSWASLEASNPNGTWVLVGRDNFSGNTATLTSWSINISYTYQVPVTWLPVTGLYTNSAGTSAYTGTATNTVYAFPGTTTLYTATASNGACVNNASVNVHSGASLFVPVINGSGSICMGNTGALTDSVIGGTWSSSNPSVATIGSSNGLVASVTSGSSVVTYTLNSGSCSGYTTKTITINALPTVAAIGGPTTICSGTNITLTDATTGGAWSSANNSVVTIGSTSGIVSQVSQGNSVITYNYSNGTCSNTATLTLTSLNTPTPVSVTPSSPAICAGGPAAMLTANGGMIAGTITASSSSPSFVEGDFTDASTSSINISSIPPGSVITGVSLTFNIGGTSGSYQSDNILNLMAPNGNIINLLYESGGASGSKGFNNVTFSSTGTTVVSSSTLVSGINYAAALLLSEGPTTPTDLRSTNTTWPDLYSMPNGPWTFVATNDYSATEDTFKNWTITINYLAPANTTWASATGLFTNSGATVAYSGTSTDTVYALPASTSVYTVTAANGSCQVSSLVTVTVNPLPTAIAGSKAICKTSTSALTDGLAGGTWNSGNIAIATIGSGTGITTGINPGTALITYTMIGTGCKATTAVTVNALPALHNLTGGGSYCLAGTGVSIGLNGSNVGINYQLYNGATAVGLPMSGTGSPLNFGLQTAAGNYTIAGINATTLCSINMTGTDTVKVNALPPVHTVINGGSYCAGGTGVHIGLNGSDLGIQYQLYKGTTIVGTPVAGTGIALDFGLFTTPGSYTVVASNGSTGCQDNMSSSADVIVNPLPDVYMVSGGGSYCAGGLGLHVLLNGSNTGISYQLYDNGIAAGSPVPGINASLDFGYQVPGGVYTVVAMDTASLCTSNMTDSATIIVNALPNVYNVLGGGSYCPGGAGVSIGLDGSDTGITYQLYVGSTMVGSAMPGTGFALDFGLNTAAGVYTIMAKNNTTLCTTNMSGNDTVTILPAPAALLLTGSGSYCSGGPGLDLGLDSSVAGVNYQLYYGGTSVGSLYAGTGSSIDFGFQSGAGNYFVIATDTMTTCTGVMADTAVITINPLPTVFPVLGGGSYCLGTGGVHIGLSGSQSGFSYQLVSGGIPFGTPVTGGGTLVDFGLVVPAGVYYVVATNTISSCTSNMSDSAIVTINPLPNVFNVTGGGPYCASGTGAPVYLSGSNTGINYQLYFGGTPVGSHLSGTGSGLNFGLHTAAGVYTIQATNATTLCVSNMSGSDSIYTIPGTSPITGASGVCNGLTATLSDITGGGTWSSGSVAIATIGSSTGVVSGISNGSAVITYMISDGCYSTVNFTVNSLPVVYTVTGGGSYCSGGTGVHVGLSSSAFGINYQLFDGSVSIGTPLAGIDSVLDFGLKTGVGTYTVVATNATTGCTSNMASYVVISITPTVTPGITIAANTGTSICSGITSIFTATTTNGGLSPAYQWKVNGTVVGTDSIAYGYMPLNGDYVTARLTSDAACVTSDTAIASLRMMVTPTELPVVSVSSNKGDSVCAGTSVIFTAIPSFGGTAPTYTWYLDSVAVATTPTYGMIPTNGNNIMVKMVSDYSCSTLNPVYSTNYMMNVFPDFIPSVIITSSPGGVVSGGSPITFTAIVTNGGPLPEYQWIKNLTLVPGATSSTYTTSTLTNGDSVTCVVKGTGVCGTYSYNSVIADIAPTGVSAISSSNADISVFPNPNTGSFTIKGTLNNLADDNINFEITDVLGQVVYSGKAVSSNGKVNERIQLSNQLANGMYLLNLRSVNEHDVIHFVIEK